MKISFDLSDADFEYFAGVLRRASEARQAGDLSQIVAKTRQLVDQVHSSGTADFIREQMTVLETLAGMVTDPAWGLKEEDRERIVDALAYFAKPDDLIPDVTPTLGFLDDAIMVEIVARELKPEIKAYTDFVMFRVAEQTRVAEAPPEPEEPAKPSSWLEARREELHARMRRLRNRDSEDKKDRSRFSLF